jgi:phospholipase C
MTLYLKVFIYLILTFLIFPPGESFSDQPSKIRHSSTDRKGAGTATPVKHLIVLMQENHSFDNYFGMYPRSQGFTPETRIPVDPGDLANTDYIEPFHLGDYPPVDLKNSHRIFQLQYADGQLDGFVAALDQAGQDGSIVMGYYDGRDLPYYWNLADEFVLFDRFFSAANKGSFANHMFWVAGTPGEGKITRQPGVYEDTVTIFDRLEEQGISWKFYVQDYKPEINYRNPGVEVQITAQVMRVPLLSIDRFLDNPALNGKIVDLSQYYQDLENGTLPAVAYIVPAGSSEHPPAYPRAGQRFTKGLLTALARSAYWESSAFLLLYDDWGGWYDHVPPPQVDEHGFGFRVPALLVSPYAKRGAIDSTQLDTTSVLKFIEENWGIAPLTERDARANNFMTAFDFKGKPRLPLIISGERQVEQTRKRSPTGAIYVTYGIGMVFALWIIALPMLFPRGIAPRKLGPGWKFWKK